MWAETKKCLLWLYTSLLKSYFEVEISVGWSCGSCPDLLWKTGTYMGVTKHESRHKAPVPLCVITSHLYTKIIFPSIVLLVFHGMEELLLCSCVCSRTGHAVFLLLYFVALGYVLSISVASREVSDKAPNNLKLKGLCNHFVKIEK